MSLFKHAPSEVKTVGRELRHVGIEIERAVGREEMFEASLRQTLDQDAAVFFVAALDRVHLGMAVERRLRGDLRQRRNRDRQILLVPVGLAGLATSTPLSGFLRCAASSASGDSAWRSAAVVSISTGSQPSAFRMCRYGG